MTPEEIEASLTAHRCYPWPRRDPENPREALATIRCDTCGELAASRTPLAPGWHERAHQAAVLSALLRVDA